MSIFFAIRFLFIFFFFLNDTPPPEFSPLPLHAALPISAPRRRLRAPRRGWRRISPSRPRALAPRRALVQGSRARGSGGPRRPPHGSTPPPQRPADRKSTRLNSSH